MYFGFLGNIGGPIPPQLQQQQQHQGQGPNQSMEFGQMSTPMMNQAGNQMPGGNQMQVGNQMQGSQMQGGNQMQSGNQIPVPVQQMQESMQHQVSIITKILFAKYKMQWQCLQLILNYSNICKHKPISIK